jgi:hypothetical protein
MDSLKVAFPLMHQDLGTVAVVAILLDGPTSRKVRTIAVLTNGVKRDILAVLFYETDFH